MKRTITTLLITLFASLSVLAQVSKSLLIGKWTLDDNTTVTFKKDGSFLSQQKIKQESKGIQFLITISTPGRWTEGNNTLRLEQDAKGIKVSMAFADASNVDETTRQSYESMFSQLSENMAKGAREKELPAVTYEIKKLEKNYFEIYNSESELTQYGTRK